MPESAPADSASLRAFYEERYAGSYMADHSVLELERVAEVLSIVPPEEIQSILDFGCGRGAWVPLLENHFPNATIVGVDVSETAIETAATEFPRATFVAFDGDRAPYEDGAFDLVFSYHVLEHVLSLRATAAEMARLAGRWVCVCLPCSNEGSFEAQMMRRNSGLELSQTGELRFAYDEEGHLRRPNSNELVMLFREHGLALSQAFFSNHSWGGIEFLLDSGPCVIDKVLSPDQRALRRALVAGHLFFRVARLPMPKPNGSVKRGIARTGLFAARPLSWLVVRPIRALVRREWERRKNEPGGSAQYLVFERPR